MFDMFARLFRKTPKHTPIPQRDTESLHNERLLPSSSRPSLTLKPSSGPKSEYQIALKTLIICSVVYLGAGFWIADSVRKAKFVIDADEFCINHVSQYCQLSCYKSGK
jgi:hypothetical protein